MSNKFRLDLEGQDEVIKKLPQYRVHFTDNSQIFSYSISEALDFSNKHKLKILKIDHTQFDDALGETTETYVYEIQNIAQCITYASFGQKNFNHGYEVDFFAFNSVLTALEDKVKKLKEHYSNNFEILDFYERRLNENQSEGLQ